MRWMRIVVSFWLALLVPGCAGPAEAQPGKFAIGDLYKGANESKPVGTGSTADAIRYEKQTGQPVGGKLHTQKGLEYVRALEKWLSKNPKASPSDRAAAQAVLDDLRDALGIKP